MVESKNQFLIIPEHSGEFAEEILAELVEKGLKQRGLPFGVEIPNKLTRQTIEKTDRGEELTYCKDAEDMFEKLGI